MSILTFMAICLVYNIVNAHQDLHVDEVIKDELRNEFDIQQEACSRLYDSDMRKVLMMLLGPVSGEQQQSSHQTKCWVNCVFQGFKLIDKMSHQINKETLHKIMLRLPPDSRSQMMARADECLQTTWASINVCDVAYTFTECMYRSMKKH